MKANHDAPQPALRLLSLALAASLALLASGVGVTPAAAFGTLCRAPPAAGIPSSPDVAIAASDDPVYPAPNTRIAFLGDSGLHPDSVRVLTMIRDWRAHAAVHLGDFDYADDPAAFDAQIESVLSDSIPYLLAIGNHDVAGWAGAGGYAGVAAKRLVGKRHRAKCTGELGSNLECRVRGVHLVLSGVGTFGTGHEAYAAATLGASRHAWKVCGFHKNMRAFQTGDKPDETGYGIYDACRAAGAVVATAHEHAYARTHLMRSFERRAMVRPADARPGGPVMGGNQLPETTHLAVRPGHSFAFVTGLGGESVRSAYFHALPKRPWLAAVATADVPDVRAGALLCTFHVRGDPRAAECEFRDAVSDRVFDRFNMTTHAEPAVVAQGYDEKKCIHTVDVPLADHASWPSRISLAGRSPVELEFDLPKSTVRGRIVSAHLQVMGAHPLTSPKTGGQQQPDLSLTVDATLHPRASRRQMSSLPVRVWRALTGTGAAQSALFSPKPGPREIKWTADEWEAHEVWVSPNLAPATSSWTLGNGGHEHVRVRVKAEGKDAATHGHVEAGALGGCLAPSLMLHIDTCAQE
ncbi:hypothetical protein H9P43_007802 [Blastocladiella emersonii ATCC 22665]|nr:hypothetical protein H9P43_007802 [Blastocladiella emersonii ATCC 22665]